MREREGGRGADGGAARAVGGAGLTPAPPVPDGLLRPLLQLAFEVARIGQASSTPVEAPRPLRPFLRFTKLPDRALAVVRRALEEDEAFRSRVADVASEELVGRAGVLYLAQPEGWAEELAELAEAARLQAEADRDEREDRAARRRVTHAEEATQRAEEAAARARAEAAQAASELSHERRERRVAQEEVARLLRKASTLEGERDAARRRAADAAADAERLRAEVAALAAELREARRAGAPPPPPPPAPAPAESAPGPDLTALAPLARTAAEATAALARALREAAAVLSPPAEAGAAGPVPAPAVGDGPAPPGSRRPPSPRRRPAPLPPAVLDDTTEAAEHLVRVPGALVLVDGYNAAKLLWPSASPAELRDRLVGALSELQARAGTDVLVVFDGADVPATPFRHGGRQPVRVTFSPPDVEADDVILALVDDVRPSRPVVVASSDRRVGDGARRRGANVISSGQLAAVLRRS